jgi:hypothetical protein
MAGLTAAALLLAALTGCASKGETHMGDCTGPNWFDSSGNSLAVIDPPLTQPSPVLNVGGGPVPGSPPATTIVLTVFSVEAQATKAVGETKTVTLHVGESATFRGFTVKVTGICERQTFYEATATDASVKDASEGDAGATDDASPTP